MLVWLWPKFARVQRASNRAIDMRVLWPLCVSGADGDMDKAKAAFAIHAFHDYAWIKDYTHDELVAFIDRLEAP
jgi:hypothetical protein